MTSWVPVPEGSGFTVANLPYCVFETSAGAPRVGAGIGDHVLDVAVALDDPVFAHASLNPFMAQGPARWREARERLTELLTASTPPAASSSALIPRADVVLRMPFDVADYVDFYSSLDHATNVGRMFRPDDAPLKPNWRHLPVGYHGRSGTVVVSGTPIARPSGQYRAPGDAMPTFGPSRRLDIEAEVGFVVGVPSPLGQPVDVDDIAQHVFGATLVNDWSARDIQAWEYVPLGPFLGKSFATSVAPWVVPLDALTAARTAPPTQDPEPLPYLRSSADWGLALDLEVIINGEPVSRPPFSTMYWTPAQQLAHLTINGASLRTGDLYASGTVSGPERTQRGSLLELTWNGTEPLRVGDQTRTFLEDGDTVTITATAPASDGGRLSFGEVSGTIAAAVTSPGR